MDILLKKGSHTVVLSRLVESELIVNLCMIVELWIIVDLSNNIRGKYIVRAREFS